MAIRLVFFGTPEFAVPSLDALDGAGLTPDLVVTQPSRPVGRRRLVTPPPVAARALELGLPLAQPESVRDPTFLERLTELAPDVCAVVAFGQIFPRVLLDLAPLGCVNVHASLLPRHRGAAPIQAAIAAGDATTGVTTMQMEMGLDSGPILRASEVEIGSRETAGTLSPRLAELGGRLLVETLGALSAGTIEAHPQNEAEVTYAGRLTRRDGLLDWSLPAAELERLVRAYDPWPGTYTELDARPVKVLAAHLPPVEATDEPLGEIAPGTLVGFDGDAVRIVCGDRRTLALDRVQRAGKRAVSGRELANGLRLSAGDRLG